MCVRACECVRVSVCACVRACVCGCGHDLKMTLRPALRTILTVDLNALDSSYKRHHSVSRRLRREGSGGGVFSRFSFVKACLNS